MGLWFVDSFDLQDAAHVGRKYKNPDNPHPELEFQTGEFDTVLKRTGQQSFKGTLQKWHGGFNPIRCGIAFHSSTVEAGVWIKGFGTGTGLFYELNYNPFTGLTATGFFGTIAGPTAITIIDGWNYLEWFFELHIYTPLGGYIHHVRLNEEDIFFDNPSVNLIGVERYTTIFPTLGNKDDYYVINPGENQQIHEDFLGPVHVVARRPIGNGVLNQWDRFPIASPQQQNWECVDDGFHDLSSVPDDNLSYLSDKLTGQEETYEMQQIDPAILGILGFQWNPYGTIPNALNPSVVGPPTTDIAEYQHIYYNPDQIKRSGGLFELSSSSDPPLNYAYRTKFNEWDLDEIELGHLNTGAYFNNSRFGFEIETGVTPIGRISQAYVEIVLPDRIETPEPPDPTLTQISNIQTFHFTKLWKFVLPDETEHYFTNHNTTIKHDGNTYTPLASLLLAAVQRRTGLDSTNTEALGIIETLTFNNFLNGLNRGTKITEYLLDWQYPWAGFFTSQVFTMQGVTFDTVKWFSQFASSAQRVSHSKGDVYGRTCRHVLGDSFCKVDLDLLKFTGVTVLAPSVQRHTILFNAPNTGDFGVPDAFGNIPHTSGYFSFGNLEWTSGTNRGVFHEIKNSIDVDISSVIIQLAVPTLFDIVNGDTANIWPGCNKLWSTCRDKFENPTEGDIDCGNTKNFGGFPTIPGKDGIFSPIGEAQRVASGRNIFGDNILGDLFDLFFPFDIPI